MKKQITSLFLALLIILSLSGCGTVGQGTDTVATSALKIETSMSDTTGNAVQTTSDTAQTTVQSTTAALTDMQTSVPQTQSEQTTSGKVSDSKPSSGGSSSGSSQSGSSSANTGTGAYVLGNGETLSGGTYISTAADQSAIRADGVSATLDGVTVNKSAGDVSSADASSFYGLNSAVHALNNATLTIKNSTINASAKGSTAVFAYNGGTVYISDSTVTSTGGGAGGIQVAGGGILYAANLTVTSASKAAVRSDRGGGILVADGGTYTSTGSDGCPAIYSTADITVKNAALTSTNSRAVIIEGKNSVTLENCDITGCDKSTKSGSVLGNVMLYQSMSGDAGVGTSAFSMTGGKMTAQAGTMFYVTNTDSIINLEGAELVYSAAGGLLTVSEGRWGTEGKNGGGCTFCAKAQTLDGDIIVDSISSLELSLSYSTYTGAINASGSAGVVNVTLDSSSKWTLTGNSYITSFSGALDSVNTNGYTLYINGVAAK